MNIHAYMQSSDAVGIRYGPTVYADGIRYGRHHYSIRYTTVYMSVYHMLVYAIGRYTLTTGQLGPRPINRCFTLRRYTWDGILAETTPAAIRICPNSMLTALTGDSTVYCIFNGIHCQ